MPFQEGGAKALRGRCRIAGLLLGLPDPTLDGLIRLVSLLHLAGRLVLTLLARLLGTLRRSRFLIHDSSPYLPQPRMHRSRRTRYWPYVLVKRKGSGWLHKGKETIMSKRFRGVLWLALGIGLLLGASPRASHAQESRTEEGVGLTIYSESTQQRVPGWGVIKEWRKIVLKKGRNEYRFRDVASQIDGTTVHFKSLTDPAGTHVLEQNFEYDLVSPDRILSRYIDQPITILPKEGVPIRGKLLSHTGKHLVLDVADASNPIQILSRAEYPNIRFPSLPGGLITKPTLVWLLDAETAGEHLAKVTYQTRQISWIADYNLVMATDDRHVDVSGWVTITNQSGASYRDAQLKLVAGDVHRAPPAAMPQMESLASVRRFKMDGEREGGFAEKSFFEYHLYTLGRKSTIPDRSTKQIELFQPVMGVQAKKIYLYSGGWRYGREPFFERNFGTSSNSKIDIFMQFENGEEDGLGIPLPAGRVRVYKEDPDDGSLEFIGEDRIDHTPKDEKILLKLGSAFDVVGERKQIDFDLDRNRHTLRESFEIRLRNHKEEDVEVVVKENLYRWANWEIEKSSHDHEKQDARTTYFTVGVAKDGERVLTYTVLYTW